MMYWQLGEYLSKNSHNASYGDSYIDSAATFFGEKYPQLKKSLQEQSFDHSHRLKTTDVYLMSIMSDAFFASASSLFFLSISQQSMHIFAHNAVRNPLLNGV